MPWPRKEPAEVWRDGDIIKIRPVNSDNIHIANYSVRLFNLVSGVRWREESKGYLRGWVDAYKYVFLHHLVLSPKEGFRVGHLNQNKSDNREKNLHHVTRSESGINRKIQTSNTVGVVGIRFDTKIGKWDARIRVNGERIYLGSFVTKEEASKAYYRAAKEYFPNFNLEKNQNKKS